MGDVKLKVEQPIHLCCDVSVVGSDTDYLEKNILSKILRFSTKGGKQRRVIF